MKISIIIPVCDDYFEANATIKSIRDTAGHKPEIIVCDDMSLVPLSLDDKQAILIRNEERIGVAASRHIGAIHATGDVILFLDAHQRLETGWYEKAVALCDGHPTTAYCCACVSLSPSNMDMTKAPGQYEGATINFYGPDRVKPNAPPQVFEGVWLQPQEGDDFYIPCLMGAAYLIPTEFFHHVGGLRLLKGWGSDEPFLSLKWWLAGGDIRMAKSIRIGHQFREASTYKTDSWKPWYNKMASVLTCLPEDKARKLISFMPNSKELTEAKRVLEIDSNIILSERAYYKSIFKRDFAWFLAYFKLSFPE